MNKFIFDVKNIKKKLDNDNPIIIKSNILMNDIIMKILVQNIRIIDNALFLLIKNQLDIIMFGDEDLSPIKNFFNKINVNNINTESDVLIILFPNEYYYNNLKNEINININILPNYKIFLIMEPNFIICNFNTNDYIDFSKNVILKDFNVKLKIFYKK
jgi:hypothetical protein